MKHSMIVTFGLVLSALVLSSRPAAAQSLPPLTAPGVVGTLSANPYAQPQPVIPYAPPPVPSVRTPTWPTPSVMAPGSGPAIVSRDGHYLGQLNTNPYDPNSVSNPYGPYGSPYAPNSINNPYGLYGSPHALQSPTNPYTLTPPLLLQR
jgi:hypothetical protein